jgi:DNA-binding response OmpR family regulator
MSKKRILIVDDDLTCARILKTGLEKTGGYEVLIELRATRAVSAARQFRPDLILLDVCLMDGDGGDVAFTLRSDPQLRDIAIVFLTSIISDRETRDGSALLGAFHFLAKPVRLGRVVACIEKHLGTADSCNQLSTERKIT